MPTLTVCMIVKNEARTLARALRSVQLVADEIIVMDTGSTDETVSIATGFPKVRVEYHRWSDDFAAARNAGLALASGDWVLVLDADEWLEDPEGLLAAIESDRVDGYYVVVRNLQPSKSITQYVDEPMVRLFRTALCPTYEGRIHEQVTPSLRRNGARLASAPTVVLVHDGYQQLTVQGGQEQRTGRNLRLLDLTLAENPDDPYYRFHRGLTLAKTHPQEGRLELERAFLLGTDNLSSPVLARLQERLAQLCLESGEDEAALQWAKGALKLDPHRAVCHLVSLTVFLSNRRWSEASQSLDWILSEGRDHVGDLKQYETLEGLVRSQLQKSGASSG